MATSRNKAPWFFNFLKEGFLLPSRNRRLFTAVCALILVYTTLLVIRNDLAVQPLAPETQLDVKALNSTEPASPDYANLLQEIKNNTKGLLLGAGAGYGLFHASVRSAVQIVVLFAAVSTYSGEQRATRTFGALLGRARAQIKGPLLTFAFGYVLETVLNRVFLVVTTALPIVLAMKQYFVALFVAALLLIAGDVCLMYFSFICSFSVVVAVAEPRCHSVAALVKAWRLVKGRKRQVALYLAVTSVLGAAVLVRTLALTWAGKSVALGLLQGFVYAILLALEQLFAACAMTALYHERREITDGKLGAAGSTKEAKA